MTENTTSSLSADARAAIDAHLDAIDRRLIDAGLPHSQRRNIVDDLETQILEMLAARAGGGATVADVKAILAELDPPEAFAASKASAVVVPPAVPPLPAAASAAVYSGPSRISRLAVFSAVFPVVMFALAFVSMFTQRMAVSQAPSSAHVVEQRPDGVHMRTIETPARGSGPGSITKLLMVLIGLSGVASPIIMPVCGVVAIGQIRRSGGRLYGLPLAVFDAIAVPILLLGVLFHICWYYVYAILASVGNLGWGAFARPSYSVAGENLGIILAITALTTLIAGFFITKAVWRSVSTPLSESSESPAASPSGQAAEPARARTPGFGARLADLFNSGALSLMLAVGGGLIALAFELLLGVRGRGITVIAFVLCEVAAIICGVMVWKTRMGKAGVLSAAIVLLATILMST